MPSREEEREEISSNRIYNTYNIAELQVFSFVFSCLLVSWGFVFSSLLISWVQSIGIRARSATSTGRLWCAHCLETQAHTAQGEGLLHFLCVFLFPSAVLPIGGCLFASVILFVLLCWVTAHTLQGVLPLCLVALFVYFLFVFFLHLFLWCISVRVRISSFWFEVFLFLFVSTI